MTPFLPVPFPPYLVGRKKKRNKEKKKKKNTQEKRNSFCQGILSSNHFKQAN
jgi:hypothetical protein